MIVEASRVGVQYGGHRELGIQPFFIETEVFDGSDCRFEQQWVNNILMGFGQFTKFTR
jgi:hypothetical protein